jgi:hypothetical protein
MKKNDEAESTVAGMAEAKHLYEKRGKSGRKHKRGGKRKGRRSGKR